MARTGRVADQPATRVFEDPATMARTFTYLFGIGATLLLVTLPLPHSPDRDTAGLVVVAVAAYVAALGFLALFDRLPLWFYEASPLLGTILVSLAVYFGGSDAPAAYAAYYFWVGWPPATSSGRRSPPPISRSPPPATGSPCSPATAVAVPALNWAVATGSLFVVGIPDDGAPGPDGEDAHASWAGRPAPTP